MVLSIGDGTISGTSLKTLSVALMDASSTDRSIVIEAGELPAIVAS